MRSKLPSVLQLLIVLTMPLHAQAENQPSALEILIREHSPLLAKITPIEQEVLKWMTVEQVYDYLGGLSATDIVLLNGETLEEFLARKGMPFFDISWYSLDAGGGTTMSTGDFALMGTFGQTDAGEMSGGGFTLVGGFTVASMSATRIFGDGFESGNTTSWTITVGD